MLQLIESQVQQFYQYFRPNYICCVQYDEQLFQEKKEYKSTDIISENVETYEEFLQFCKDYHMKGSLFSVYRRLKPNSNRETNNVIYSKCFFVDIDNDVKDEVSKKFEKLLKDNNLTFNIKVISGGGKHYYFPHTPMDIDDGNREMLIDISSRLKFWLQENNVNIDPKIYDIARLTRIWGSYNIKAQASCSIVTFREATSEEEDNNFNFLNKLQPKSMQVYNVQNTKCKYCPLIEYCINNDLGKEGVMKNDVLFKNAAAFIRENKRSKNELSKLAKRQKHSESEFFAPKGWWNKNEIEFNCFELRKWNKEYFPELVIETCRKCMFENVNNVIYVNDDSKTFNQLKSEYRDTMKLPINKYVTIRGVIEPAKEFKTAMLMGNIYKRKMTEGDETETEVTIEDIDVETQTYIRYIGEKVLDKEELKALKLVKIKDLKVDFYIYNFISQTVLYKVLSEEELPAGEYFIDGTLVEVSDKILLGEQGRMMSYIKVLFCHTARSTSIKYNSWTEAFNRFKYDEDTITNYLCSLSFNEDEGNIFEQPVMRMKLYYAFLFSSRLENYPLHLVISGVPGTGKSRALTAIHKKFSNEVPVIAAENSTVKAFVPSYYSKKNTRGFLAEAHRILFVDEFFSILSRATQNSQGNEVADLLQGFNNILTNEDRMSGSGIGRFNIRMTAKTLWATNPTDTLKEDFIGSLRKIEVNTLQRFLFFHIGKEGLSWVGETPSHKKIGVVDIDNKDWLALYDFMQDKKLSKVEFDFVRVDNIMESLKNIVPVDVVNHLYHLRTIKHSAPLIMEGLVKLRVLFEKDKSLQAKEEDYQLFKQLWEYIINSWRSGLINWSNNLTNQLSAKQLAMLELIPYDGIWDVKLKRECEKLSIDEEEIKYNITWFRNVGLTRRGEGEENKNKVYRVKDVIVNLSHFETKQQTL